MKSQRERLAAVLDAVLTGREEHVPTKAERNVVDALLARGVRVVDPGGGTWARIIAALCECPVIAPARHHLYCPARRAMDSDAAIWAELAGDRHEELASDTA